MAFLAKAVPRNFSSHPIVIREYLQKGPNKEPAQNANIFARYAKK